MLSARYSTNTSAPTTSASNTYQKRESSIRSPIGLVALVGLLGLLGLRLVGDLQRRLRQVDVRSPHLYRHLGADLLAGEIGLQAVVARRVGGQREIPLQRGVSDRCDVRLGDDP